MMKTKMKKKQKNLFQTAVADGVQTGIQRPTGKTMKACNKRKQKQSSRAVQTLMFGDYAVRVMMIDGNLWWVLQDVCDVLSLVDSQIIAKLYEEYVCQVFIWTGGVAQEVHVVNDSGLRVLIQRFDSPYCKRFQRWIVSEGRQVQKTLINNVVVLPDKMCSRSFVFKGHILRMLTTEDGAW
ncbi:MAG: hypothetical protein LBP87_05080, partial [Planctomycetaceae bacterium]|nr:hypothetical protein [Planctomycetaceae bacterium]